MNNSCLYDNERIDQNIVNPQLQGTHTPDTLRLMLSMQRPDLDIKQLNNPPNPNLSSYERNCPPPNLYYLQQLNGREPSLNLNDSGHTYSWNQELPTSEQMLSSKPAFLGMPYDYTNIKCDPEREKDPKISSYQYSLRSPSSVPEEIPNSNYRKSKYIDNFSQNMLPSPPRSSEPQYLYHFEDLMPERRQISKEDIKIDNLPLSNYRANEEQSGKKYNNRIALQNWNNIPHLAIRPEFEKSQQLDLNLSSEQKQGLSKSRRKSTRQCHVPPETMARLIAGPFEGKYKFACLYKNCAKRFSRKYNIQSHIQTHLSDRPYRCYQCKAGFVRQHDLRRHCRIHGGEEAKRWVCDCGKAFARCDALNRHRQRNICKGGVTVKMDSPPSITDSVQCLSVSKSSTT